MHSAGGQIGGRGASNGSDCGQGSNFTEPSVAWSVDFILGCMSGGNNGVRGWLEKRKEVE